MSHYNTCPIEVNAYGILACKLPDDDVAKTAESELLKMWGFPDEVIRVSHNTKHEIRPCENSNNSTEHSEITPLVTEAKAEPNTEYENSALRVSESDKCYLSTGDEHNFQSKSVLELYEQAMACYRSGHIRESLIYINDALASEVISDHVMLLTLKAKVLNSTGNHMESLKSIAEVNSDFITKELLVEGAMALDKLDLHFTAEEWLKKVILDKSEEPEGLPWTKKAFQLFQDVRNQRIYGPLLRDMPLTVSLSKEGRGLYAKTTINKGEIFSELPEFLEQSLTSKIMACAYCGLSLANPNDVLIKGKPVSSDLKKAIKKWWPKREATPCQVCNRVVYCSELCRNDAWRSYHKVICPLSSNSASAVLYDVRDSFKGVPAADGSSWQGWWNAEFSPVLMARMWAAMLIQAKLRAGDRKSPTVDNWLTVLSQGEKYFSNCETPIANNIPKIFELMKSIFKRSKVIEYKITDADFNKKYHKVLMNYISFHDVSNPIQQFLDKIKSDGKLHKKIGIYFQEPLPKSEHHGLFALTSCINHSCLPNAEIRSGLIDGKPGITIVARRNISALEEILVSYVNPELGRTERRDKLLRRYRFWCQCVRCMHEGDGPDKCTHCGKLASCSSGIKTSEPSQDMISSLKHPVDTQNKNEMLILTDKIESLTLADESLPINSSSTRNSQQESENIADLEKIKTSMVDPEIKERCEVIKCCGSGHPSNKCVKNELRSILLTSDVSMKSTENVTSVEEEESAKQSDNAANEEVKGSTKHSDISINGDIESSTSLSDDATNKKVEESTMQSDSATKKEVEESTLQSEDATREEVKESTTMSDNATNKEVEEITTHLSNATNVHYEPQTLIIGKEKHLKRSSVIGTEIITKFPHCSRCGRAWYCSQKCQKDAWKKDTKRFARIINNDCQYIIKNSP